MMNFEEELQKILFEDPLDLLKSKPKQSKGITADQRLVESFNEITEFVKEHGREPDISTDIKERKLYSRLQGLKDDPIKAQVLLEHDPLNLLSEVDTSHLESVDDVFAHDPLGLLGDDSESEDPEEIFNLKNVPKEVEKPSHIARRVPCEDFNMFATIFKECHSKLESNEWLLVPFKNEQQITEGHFFLLNGILVYVSEVGKKEKGKNGKVNARLRCIYENETESDVLLRSLATALYLDEGGKRIINPIIDIYGETDRIVKEDTATGYIYILKSMSADKEISSIKDLYKIGYSTQPVEQRIKNAKQETTYLMADVEIISEYMTFNLNTQKLEHLLHTFFSGSCLDIKIHDNEGREHHPREWFIAPIHIIETTIKLLINEEIIHYRYNPKSAEIEPLE